VTAGTDGGGLEASQHADTTREVGAEERQQPQQQPKPKPKLQLTLQPTPQPAPEPKSAPTPARRCETVKPRAMIQRAPVVPGPVRGPTPTAGSSIALRCLILGRDQSVPLSNIMDHEIASAKNRALFHQKAPAHVRIMNAKWNARAAITAITHPNATAEMAIGYRDIIITAARTVARGVADVEEIKTWERLMIHEVALVRYMGKGTEGLQKLREEFEQEDEGIAIPTMVQWLAKPRSIRERRLTGEIAASSAVFVIKGRRLAQSLIKKGIKGAGMWYRVEAFTNAGPDRRCELCCGWGHIENKCGNRPKCCYCSGNHRTSDHKCNVVGCMAKQGSLCGHTLEKCPNCKGNHIAFSSRCAMMSEAAKAARQSRMTGTAGQAPAGNAMHMATGTYRVVLGRRPRGGSAGGGGSEEEEMADEMANEMADVQEDEAAGEARDVVMTEPGTATTAATETESESEAGALATND